MSMLMMLNVRQKLSNLWSFTRNLRSQSILIVGHWILRRSKSTLIRGSRQPSTFSLKAISPILPSNKQTLPFLYIDLPKILSQISWQLSKMLPNRITAKFTGPTAISLEPFRERSQNSSRLDLKLSTLSEEPIKTKHTFSRLSQRILLLKSWPSFLGAKTGFVGGLQG